MRSSGTSRVGTIRRFLRPLKKRCEQMISGADCCMQRIASRRRCAPGHLSLSIYLPSTCMHDPCHFHLSLSLSTIAVAQPHTRDPQLPPLVHLAQPQSLSEPMYSDSYFLYSRKPPPIPPSSLTSKYPKSIGSHVLGFLQPPPPPLPSPRLSFSGF